MPATSKSKSSVDLRYAARRVAAGQTIAEVAALFDVTIAEMQILVQGEHFRQLVQRYRQLAARPLAERMAEREALVLDALDCLVEDRNASTVHWLAGHMGLFDQRANGSAPRHELDHLRWGPFEEIYEQLPRHLQEAYREYDPEFVPRSPDNDDRLSEDELAEVDNLIRFPGASSVQEAVARQPMPAIDHLATEFAMEGEPAETIMAADVVYEDILDLVDTPEDEVEQETVRRDDRAARKGSRKNDKWNKPLTP